MSSTRSAIIGRGDVAAGGALTLAVVDSGQTWITKQLVFYNKDVVAGTLLLRWETAGGVFQQYIAIEPLAANGVARIPLWHVSQAGDILTALALSAAFTVSVSGTKLIGTA